MAVKLSPKDAVKKFGVRLLDNFPLENSRILDKVDGAGLLPLDYKATIISKATRTEKVAFFKEKVLGSEAAAKIHLPKLLDVMDNCGDATAIALAKDIREATGLIKSNPDQTPPAKPTPPKGEEPEKSFDCLAMSRYLTKEWVALCGLPYDSMKLQLKANGVITDQQRDEIDDLVGTNKMDKVLKIVQNGLDLKLPKKYRGFLKSMEESKDDTLIEYAKSLGGSKSVPDH